MNKDLKGELELYVKFVVFDLKATRKDVNEHELLPVLEELGTEISKLDTDELLKNVNVNVDGMDRTKKGGELLVKVKYMNSWLMGVQKNSTLAEWQSGVTELIQHLQRTHDQIKLGQPGNYKPVTEDYFGGKRYD